MDHLVFWNSWKQPQQNTDIEKPQNHTLCTKKPRQMWKWTGQKRVMLELVVRFALHYYSQIIMGTQFHHLLDLWTCVKRKFLHTKALYNKSRRMTEVIHSNSKVTRKKLNIATFLQPLILIFMDKLNSGLHATNINF